MSYDNEQIRTDLDYLETHGIRDLRFLYSTGRTTTKPTVFAETGVQRWKRIDQLAAFDQELVRRILKQNWVQEKILLSQSATSLREYERKSRANGSAVANTIGPDLIQATLPEHPGESAASLCHACLAPASITPRKPLEKCQTCDTRVHAHCRTLCQPRLPVTDASTRFQCEVCWWKQQQNTWQASMAPTCQMCMMAGGALRLVHYEPGDSRRHAMNKLEQQTDSGALVEDWVHVSCLLWAQSRDFYISRKTGLLYIAPQKPETTQAIATCYLCAPKSLADSSTIVHVACALLQQMLRHQVSDGSDHLQFARDFIQSCVPGYIPDLLWQQFGEKQMESAMVDTVAPEPVVTAGIPWYLRPLSVQLDMSALLKHQDDRVSSRRALHITTSKLRLVPEGFEKLVRFRMGSKLRSTVAADPNPIRFYVNLPCPVTNDPGALPDAPKSAAIVLCTSDTIARHLVKEFEGDTMMEVRPYGLGLFDVLDSSATDSTTDLEAVGSVLLSIAREQMLARGMSSHLSDLNRLTPEVTRELCLFLARHRPSDSSVVLHRLYIILLHGMRVLAVEKF